MSGYILECINISKNYDGKSAPVLEDVNFSVRKSSFTAVTGESGTGKTTLLNILNGIAVPDTGSVLIEGKNLSALSEKERCYFRLKNFGLVFQDDNLADNFTVYENIIIPYLGLRIKPDKKAIENLCGDLGIGGLLNRYPSSLSGGQKQRAAIARAVCMKPLIIFADEPTGSLDGAAEEEVLNIFQKINRETGVTIIAVTHSKNCVARADTHIPLGEVNGAGRRNG